MLKDQETHGDVGGEETQPESVETWRRTLGVTATSQVFSILGFSFVFPFLPLYLQQLGVHGTVAVTLWAAILSGGSALLMATCAPVWGILADRYGRKIMVVRAAISASLIVGLMGLVQNPYQLLALGMLQGAFTGTVSASQALVASQSPRQRLGFNLGVMQTAVFVGTSLGPFFGGVVADAVGFRLSFAVAAGFLFVAGAIVALFVEEEKRFAQQRGAPRPPFLGGLSQAVRIPGMAAMIGAYFCVEFGITVVFPVLPQFIQYLQGSAGHVATLTGLILAGAGVAGAISSVSVGFLSDRWGYKPVLVTAAAVAALLSIPQFFVIATWQIFVLRVLIGFSLGAIMPSASALLASLVPSERRGTAYGLTQSATSLGFAAGPLTAAAVVGVAGMRTVFLTAAVLLGVIAVWVGMMVSPRDEFHEDVRTPNS